MTKPVFRILGEDPTLSVIECFLERDQFSDAINLVARCGKKQRVLVKLSSDNGRVSISKIACTELGIKYAD